MEGLGHALRDATLLCLWMGKHSDARCAGDLVGAWTELALLCCANAQARRCSHMLCGQWA